MSTPPQIAIIGAGPAGLTLGLLLHLQNIPFTIYELRAKPTEEEFVQSSGSLDLHEDTGLAAIRACDLYDEFVTLTGECAEADVVSDKDGNILHEDDGSGAERPEISRHALTRMLLSKLPSQCIKWEHKLLEAKPNEENGRYDLNFSGVQDTETVDLLIGADGAWSRIRALLTDKKPHYSGVTFITLTIADLDTRFPHLGKFVGPGSFAAPGEHNIVMCQRGTKGSARMYLAISTPDEDLATSSGLSRATPDEARAILLNKDAGKTNFFASYGPLLQDLITRGLEDMTSEVLDIKPLYMLPVGQLAWQHRNGVTLIGDAAHLMTPFAGEGVNLAMRDALDLSRAIKEAWVTTDEAKGQEAAFRRLLEDHIPEVEKDLFDRSEATARDTWQNLKLFTAENAAQSWAGMLKQFAPMAHPE